MSDSTLKAKLLKTREDRDPILSFCEVASSCGVVITPGELASMGEESCAAMLRSQNGGGEIEPMGWSDDYELFFLLLDR